MERASVACSNWLKETYPDSSTRFYVVCGQGNNGGDGLAIARLLSGIGYRVNLYVIGSKTLGSSDFEVNLARVKKLDGRIYLRGSIEDLAKLRSNDVLIDALFGTGLRGTIKGELAETIGIIRNIECHKISIDIPSGLYSDLNNETTEIVVKADHTLTFQSPKFSFLFPDMNRKFNSSTTPKLFAILALACGIEGECVVVCC